MNDYTAVKDLFTIIGFAGVAGVILFSFLAAIGLDNEIKRIDSAIRDLRDRVARLEDDDAE